MTGNERIAVPLAGGELDARFWLPAGAVGVVVLAGENSRQRLRPTGDYLPSVFSEARLATLAFDVGAQFGTAAQAEREQALRRSVLDACAWLDRHEAVAGLPLGVVGIGKGAALALDSCAQLGRQVCALAARSMQCEAGLAGVSRISAPTLLIAGSLDDVGIGMSRLAYAALRCRKRFEIVPGATRAFDEPGSLEVVARLVRSWFVQHLH